jgi:hypothetical protein
MTLEVLEEFLKDNRDRRKKPQSKDDFVRMVEENRIFDTGIIYCRGREYVMSSIGGTLALFERWKSETSVSSKSARSVLEQYKVNQKQSLLDCWKDVEAIFFHSI